MKIVEKFRASGNKEIAAAQAAYMRNQFEYIGLKTPVRRALSKDFLKEKSMEAVVDWTFVWQMWNLSEREFQYLACDYLLKMKRFLKKADLQQIRELALVKSWWDTVDVLDELVGTIFLADENEVKTIILAWAKSENFWIRRLAIDCQLGFKEKTDTDLLARNISENLSGSDFENEFFINKSIGWALRDFSKSNPDWVQNFISENETKMSKLSLREASKYLK